MKLNTFINILSIILISGSISFGIFSWQVIKEIKRNKNELQSLIKDYKLVVSKKNANDSLLYQRYDKLLFFNQTKWESVKLSPPVFGMTTENVLSPTGSIIMIWDTSTVKLNKSQIREYTVWISSLNQSFGGEKYRIHSFFLDDLSKIKLKDLSNPNNKYKKQMRKYLNFEHWMVVKKIDEKTYETMIVYVPKNVSMSARIFHYDTTPSQASKLDSFFVASIFKDYCHALYFEEGIDIGIPKSKLIQGQIELNRMLSNPNLKKEIQENYSIDTNLRVKLFRYE